MNYTIKLCIGGIDMGEFEATAGESVELIPIDCFFGFSKAMQSAYGAASDGICVRPYNNLGEIPKGEHFDFSPEMVSSPPIPPISSSTLSNVEEEEKIRQNTSRNTPACEISCASHNSEAPEIEAWRESCIPAKKKRRPREKKDPIQCPADYLAVSQGGQLPKGVVRYVHEKLGSHWMESTIKVLFENFVDYHLKKGNLWADWLAAWRQWVRNECSFGAARQTPATMVPKIVTDENREEFLRD